jgi:MYXO-CTERM domain-containing protein
MRVTSGSRSNPRAFGSNLVGPMTNRFLRLLASYGVLGLASLVALEAAGEVLHVGPNGAHAAPCAAFAAASDGDTIEIDGSGDYAGDVCVITKSQLTILGVGGMAKVDAAGSSAQGKAIWVVQGDDTTIENVEFSGAAVPDRNGAGIRQEGANLTVRGCVFRDNENGILAGDNADSEILIEHSEFDGNGAGDGYSHNLYVNHVKKLVFRYNWSHRASVGHLLKSRAAENHVLYNRVSGEEGSASYELDFPNGGRTYVIGNLIQQGATTENPTMLAYLEEGPNAASPDQQLYVVNNTFVNERSAGRFVLVAEGAAPAVIVNNVFAGSGELAYPAGSTFEHNEQQGAACLVNASAFDYRLLPGSTCVDAGTDPGTAGELVLLPSEHYAHPLDHVARSRVGAVDLGAYELGSDEETAGAGGALNGAGASTSAGTGGRPLESGGEGGTVTPAGGAASGEASDGPASAESDESGCGCRTTPQSGGTRAWSLLLLIAAAHLIRRSRSERWRR